MLQGRAASRSLRVSRDRPLLELEQSLVSVSEPLALRCYQITNRPTHCHARPVFCRLFVDGKRAGEIAEGRSYTNDQGVQTTIDGGDPILLNGNVVLCSRSDATSERHFDGKLAYLGATTWWSFAALAARTSVMQGGGREFWGRRGPV